MTRPARATRSTRPRSVCSAITGALTPPNLAALEQVPLKQLSGKQLFRLHHLHCINRAHARQEGPVTAPHGEVVARLLSSLSPFRPCSSVLWHGPATPERDPDMGGNLCNASFTHLGALEIIRLDRQNAPARLDFVPFATLNEAVFASPGVFRAARLFHDDGRDEIVWVPTVYGLSWEIGGRAHRDATLTEFVAHAQGAPGLLDQDSGIGLGHQDLLLEAGGGTRLFGIGPVGRIAFPLDARDPRFDHRARTRGLDPQEIRARYNDAGL